MRFATRSLLITAWATSCVFFSYGAVFAQESRYEKHQAVLEHLGVPSEQSHYGIVSAWDGAQTRQGFETILKYIDPNRNLTRYATWDDDKITLYLDRDEKNLVDFAVAFKTAGEIPSDRHGLVRAFRATARNTKPKPLYGLRIALDPGHMGGPYWDKKTGKYVQTKDGRYVSEGEMALHVCLLLARELRALGADVLLTRHTLSPVTELPDQSFDLEPFALAEIRNSTDMPWFDELLNGAPLGERLFERAERHPEIQRLRGERKRHYYFIHRADLEARARVINDYDPHATVIVHFDSSRTDRLQSRTNEVRAYVPGNVFREEMASREQRATILRAVLDGHRWVESTLFSGAIVNGVSESTGVPLKKSVTDVGAIKVTDGVYARNLALTRLIHRGVISYLEVLYYDHSREFARLAVKDRHDQVDGIDISYSSRLDDIVQGLKRGILDYVRNTAKPAGSNTNRLP